MLCCVARVAQVVRRLHSLAGAAAVRLQVCRRALDIVRQLQAAAAQQADSTSPNRGTCMYPAAELQWLAAQCRRDAGALTRGFGSVAHGGADPHGATSLHDALLDMARSLLEAAARHAPPDLELDLEDMNAAAPCAGSPKHPASAPSPSPLAAALTSAAMQLTCSSDLTMHQTVTQA